MAAHLDTWRTVTGKLGHKEKKRKVKSCSEVHISSCSELEDVSANVHISSSLAQVRPRCTHQLTCAGRPPFLSGVTSAAAFPTHQTLSGLFFCDRRILHVLTPCFCSFYRSCQTVCYSRETITSLFPKGFLEKHRLTGVSKNLVWEPCLFWSNLI